MKFVIKSARKGHGESSHTIYWFTLVAPNGEIVASSEMFTRKQTAIDTIESIRCGLSPETPIDDRA